MKYTPSQLEAINLRNTNILVSAGAGSGKTGVLKERVIKYLEEGIHIDELIILTFTNVAAKEMKSRITLAIMNDSLLDSELKRINQAVISTFDSFCLSLVKQYHYLLDLPKSINIADKIRLMKLEEETLERVLKDNYIKASDSFKDFVFALFQRGDNLIYDSIKKLAKFLNKQPNTINYINSFEERYFKEDIVEDFYVEFKEYIYGLFNNLVKTFENLKQEISGCETDKIIDYIRVINNIIVSLSKIDDFDEFINKLINIDFPRSPYIKKDNPIKDALKRYHELLKEQLKQIKTIFETTKVTSKKVSINNVLKTKSLSLELLNLTKQYLILLQVEKKKLNLYDFKDIFAFAIDLLEKTPEIRDYYKKNIVEIMVDEYQDTNDLQVYFLNLIANNNLFMVGDMKQSIYGFRDANPKNFLDRYHEYSKTNKGKVIDLRENFRSRKQIINDINFCFNHTMNEEIGGINYQDNQSLIFGLKEYEAEDKNDFYGIELIRYNSKMEKEADPSLNRTKIEIKLLASDILERIQNKQILNVKTKSFRPLRFSDIAILIDRKTDFNQISRYLSKHGIPVNLYSKEPFLVSEEMLFLTSFLKLIRCFYDEYYLKDNFKQIFYSVTRSFVYQIKDENIISFLIKEEIKQLDDLKALTKYKQFTKIYESIKYLLEMINDLPLYDFILEVYQTTNIFHALKYLDNPSEKEEKLDFFAKNIKGFECFSFNDLIAYLDDVEQHFDWDIEYSQEEKDIDAVKIMTMHASKGLQFPVVYLLGLSKKFNFEENKDFFIYDNHYGIITNVIEEGYYPTFMRYLYLEKAKKEYISERIRLFYVALTRAKEHIIMIIDDEAVKENKNLLDETGYVDSYIRMKYNSYMDFLSSTNIFSRSHSYIPEVNITKDTKENIITSKKTINIKSFNFNPKIKTKKTYSKKNNDILSDEIIESITYGDYIHHILEQVDFYNLDDSLNMIKDKRLKESIRYLLNSELLDLDKHPKIYQEWEFYDNSLDIVKHGIIDLLVEYDNMFYIIDYKLKHIDDEAYKKQLQGYFDYLSSKTTKEVHCYLYSIMDKTIKRII